MRADRLLALALGASLFAAPSAFGYSLMGPDWSWQSQPMSDPFYFNPSSFPAGVGTQTQVTNAFTGAMDVWKDEGASGFAFTYGGNVSTTSWTSGDKHIASYYNGSIGGATLAITQTWSWGGDITDCDQRYYASNAWGSISWSAATSGAGWFELDLERVMIHELGHCAGLDHSASVNAIMYESATEGTGPGQRHLHSDDIAGIQAMYGAAVGADMVLDLLTDLVPGQAAKYRVDGADPGEKVYFIRTNAGEGDGPCYGFIGGQCMSILGPLSVLGSANANNSGRAVLNINVPSNEQLGELSVQAVIVRGSTSMLSNPISAIVEPTAGCATGELPDCQGACWDLTWVGDGYCDDGTSYQWGDPDYFCAAYDWDAGDC